MPKKYDFTGTTHGRLYVESLHVQGRDGDNLRYWACRCVCGKICIKKTTYFTKKSNTERSCGCVGAEKIGLLNASHGDIKSPEYGAWAAMKSRCFNQKEAKYRRYGGRGITVCDRWKNSYEAFLEDMGRKPSPNHSLDRINLDGNYHPENCRWATVDQQAWNTSLNKIITVDGVAMCLGEAAKTYGAVTATTIGKRLKRGWSVEEAVKLPSKTPWQ